MNWVAYFENHIRHRLADPVLEPRPHKCGTCPIDCMYAEIAEPLRKQPEPFRRRVSEKWFCHTNPDLACRGNWDFQGLDK